MASINDVFELFKKNKELSVKEIIDHLGISKQTAHIVLHRLGGQNKGE